MTEFSFSVPYRDEDDFLIEVVDAARETLEGDEYRVVEQLAFDALGRGVTRVGDLFSELEAAGGRKLVDEARVGIGMDTIANAEAPSFEYLPPGPDAEGRTLQSCAAENCNTFPQDAQGVWVPVADRVWWCGQHKDQAGPEDHLPEEPTHTLDLATMSVRALPKEQERLLAEDREREEKARERQERQLAEGERLRKLEAEYQASLKPPVGFAPR